MTRIAQQILVFEPRPYWTPELQRQFLDQESVVVRICPKRGDLLDRLAEGCSSVVVLVLDSHTRECVEVAGRIAAVTACVIAVGDLKHGELEWPLRESGVVSCHWGHLTGVSLARIIHRSSSILA